MLFCYFSHLKYVIPFILGSQPLSLSDQSVNSDAMSRKHNDNLTDIISGLQLTNEEIHQTLTANMPIEAQTHIETNNNGKHYLTVLLILLL